MSCSVSSSQSRGSCWTLRQLSIARRNNVASDVTLTRSGDSLVLAYDADNDITNLNHYAGRAVETAIFADGAVDLTLI
jgi:hypothetical protein